MPGERTDLRWDRARHARCPERSREDVGYTRGSSSAPSDGTNAGTTTCGCVFREFPIPRAGIDAGGMRAELASRVQGHYEAIHGELLGADGPFDLDHVLGRRPLRRPRCRAARARHGSSLPGWADRAERHPRRRSRTSGDRRPLSSAMTSSGAPRRWSSSAQPSRTRKSRARRAEQERRRLKRGLRVIRTVQRPAPGAAARRPRLRPCRLDDDAPAPAPEQVAAARDRECALLHQRPEGIHDHRGVRIGCRSPPPVARTAKRQMPAHRSRRPRICAAR